MSVSPLIEAFLRARGAHYTTEWHRPTFTSRETACRARVDAEHLAKSIVLEDEHGVLLAVIPASRRLELGRVREELGRALHLCGEPACAALFPDCAFGAIPPLGAAYGLETVLDTSLETCDEVFFEGGDHETLVRMGGGAFLDLLEHASVADMSVEGARLQEALVTRERLGDRLACMRRALDAPLGAGPRWLARFGDELDGLCDALAEHILETEGLHGVLGEIEGQAPRLAREVSRLRTEHAVLAAGCLRLRARLGGAPSPRDVRRRARRLVARFERHRHRGADLVYEAFGVDLGGG